MLHETIVCIDLVPCLALFKRFRNINACSFSYVSFPLFFPCTNPVVACSACSPCTSQFSLVRTECCAHAAIGTTSVCRGHFLEFRVGCLFAVWYSSSLASSCWPATSSSSSSSSSGSSGGTAVITAPCCKLCPLGFAAPAIRQTRSICRR